MTLILAGLFLLVTFGAFRVAKKTGLTNRAYHHLRSDELHHAYVGALLVLIGWWWSFPVCAWVGVLLCADDAWQHAYQVATRRVRYRSPLHILWGKVMSRWPWVREVTIWLDDRF